MSTSNTPQKSTGISSLYIVKCICAFLVVTCHTPMGQVKEIISPIAMAAVPIFFLISGYFLYSPDERKSYERAKKSLKKIVPIFLLVQLFYWAWLLPNHGNLLNSWRGLADIFLTGSLFSGHLWYLTAMLHGLLVLGLFFRMKWGRWLWCFLPLHILALLGGRYSFLITDDDQPEYLFYVYNSICYTFTFMSAGYLIAKYEHRLTHFKHWGILLLALCLLGIGERFALNAVGFGYANGPFLSCGFIAIAALCWALSHKSLGSNTLGERIGSKYSGNIYYFHIAVATIVEKAFTLSGGFELYHLLGSVFVFLATLPVAYVIVRVQERLGWQVLR